MIPKIKILAAGLLLAALCSSASAESFFRPLFSFDSPVNTGFGSTGGYGFVTGARLGAAQEHELSFEWHYNRWNVSASYDRFSVSGGETNMPFLLNYRHHFGTSADQIRFYAGPALGLTSTKLSLNATAPGSLVSVDNTAWAFTASGSLGVLIKLTDKTDLDLGYRYLWTKGRDFSVGPTSVSVDDRQTHMVYTGLNFRF
jgi:opacity protein-like surface antigen